MKTREGNTFQCGHGLVAAGANTPYLSPELQPYMKVTGHPVFWLKPKNSKYFSSPYLSVFAAEILVRMGCSSTILSSSSCASGSHGKSRFKFVGVASTESISLPNGKI